MDEEDDLLTPYKEESIESYEQKMRDGRAYMSDSSMSSGCGASDNEHRIAAKRARELLNGNRKRPGRPRKIRVETPPEDPLSESAAEQNCADVTPQEEMAFEDMAEATTPLTESVKRRPGRPKNNEVTANSEKRMLQAMKFIIPDGVKRKARPSRMLLDTDALPFGESSNGSDHGDERPRKRGRPRLYPRTMGKPSNGTDPTDDRPKKRGRPRLHPIKVRVLQSDGTPRGRGRPRLVPKEGDDTAKVPKQRGRPRTRPVRDPNEIRKRGRKPGPKKRLGRPPKGQEKWRIKLNNLNNKLAAFTENEAASNPDDLSWTMVERSFVQNADEKIVGQTAAPVRTEAQEQSDESSDDDGEEEETEANGSTAQDDDDDDDDEEDSDDSDDSSSSESTAKSETSGTNKKPEIAKPVEIAEPAENTEKVEIAKQMEIAKQVDVNGIAPVNLSSSDDDDEEDDKGKKVADFLPSDKVEADEKTPA